MSFDRIDRLFARPAPVRLEPAKHGDPCPDPKCREGQFEWVWDLADDPDKPPRRVLRCTACRVEAAHG